MRSFSPRAVLVLTASLSIPSAAMLAACADATPPRQAAGTPAELVPGWLAGEERGALLAALTADGSLVDELKAALRSDSAFQSELATSVAEKINLSSEVEAVAGALRSDASFRDELAAAIATMRNQERLPDPCEAGETLEWTAQGWSCAAAGNYVEVEGDTMSGPLEIASAAPGPVLKAVGGQGLPLEESVPAIVLVQRERDKGDLG